MTLVQHVFVVRVDLVEALTKLVTVDERHLIVLAHIIVQLTENGLPIGIERELQRTRAVDCGNGGNKAFRERITLEQKCLPDIVLGRGNAADELTATLRLHLLLLHAVREETHELVVVHVASLSHWRHELGHDETHL